MRDLLHNLILDSARSGPARPAVSYKGANLDYGALADSTHGVAQGLLHLGLARGERVAVYLPKQVETVTGLFGVTLAGGVFVPVNPLLKAEQVGHILREDRKSVV